MTHLSSVRREPLHELLRRARQPVGEHPHPDELTGYAAGELSEEATDRFRDHLVRCRECRELLLLQSDLETPGVVDFAAVPAWRAMARRIRRERWQIPIVAAASLVLVLLGFSAKTSFDLRSMVTRLSQPQLNVEIHDLESAEDRVRDFERGAGGKVLEVSPNADSITFIMPLDAPEDAGAEDYRVEILDAGGHAIWSGRGLEVELGTATLGVPRHFLDSGDYEVLVFVDESDQPSRLLGKYPVTLRYLTGSAEAPRESPR